VKLFRISSAQRLSLNGTGARGALLRRYLFLLKSALGLDFDALLHTDHRT
jgi:hypothetical protein